MWKVFVSISPGNLVSNIECKTIFMHYSKDPTKNITNEHKLYLTLLLLFYLGLILENSFLPKSGRCFLQIRMWILQL